MKYVSFLLQANYGTTHHTVGMIKANPYSASRYMDVYFSRFPGYYYSGDYAIQDEEGYFWLLGQCILQLQP